MIYLFIIIFLLFCIYIYDIRKVKAYRYGTFYAVIFVLILLNVLSYKIGGDTEAYMYNWQFYRSIFEVNIFDEITVRSFKERPGWIILTSFLKGLCNNFIILRIILACWVNLVVAYFVRTNTRLIFTTLLIYFIASYFNYNFEILRESIAVSFFLLAYPFYVKECWGKYLLCFLIAFMFHESSLVMLLMPFFRLFENMGIKKVVIVMVGLYMVILSLRIVDVLLNVLPDSFAFYDKAYSYLNSDTYGENTRVNMFLSFFPSFLIPLLSLIVLRSNSQMKTLSIFIISSTLFQVLATRVYIFYRFNNYTLIPLAIAYAEAIYILSKKIVWKGGKEIFFIPILLLYILYKIYSVYLGSDGASDRIDARMYERYYPYTSIVAN